MSRARQWTLLLTAAMLLGPVVWLAAQAGSLMPGGLAVSINVHGLLAPGYGGPSGRPLAPLSERIIADARHDASTQTSTSPKPAEPPAGGPSSPSPSPSALPLPTPSLPSLPSPTAVPLLSPVPTPPLLPTPGL